MVKHWCWNYYNIKKDSIAYCNFCSQFYGAGIVQRMLNHLLNQCKKIPSDLRGSLINNDNKDKIKKNQCHYHHLHFPSVRPFVRFFNRGYFIFFWLSIFYFVMRILGYYFFNNLVYKFYALIHKFYVLIINILCTTTDNNC